MEKVIVIPLQDKGEKWMIGNTCLDRDILPEFLGIVNDMKKFFLHPIIRNREIRLKKNKNNMI